MRAVIFDLGGTLADTGADLIAAVNATFAELGYGAVLDPLTDGGIAQQAGGRAMLNYGFASLGIEKDAWEIEEYYPLIIKHYAESLCVHSTLYPGCHAALTCLQTANVPLAICTNKPGVLVRPLLAQLGIADFFRTIIAADTLPVRKPHRDPLVAAITSCDAKIEQSVLIGDSSTDRETARAAGAKSVLVSFGPLSDQVTALEPDAILHDYQDIKDVLASI